MRNCRNGSYYRYERPEKSRSRIRPLELFPNGLLIPKSADTIVEPKLEVKLVGRWTDEFFVEPTMPEKVKSAFAEELDHKRVQLAELEAQMATVDPNAHGGRGSHANKIKAVARRVESLERGLVARPKDTAIQKGATVKTTCAFKLRDYVQLPSGLPAIVLGTEGQSVQIGTKTRTGAVLKQPVPAQMLRPLEHRHLATV